MENLANWVENTTDKDGKECGEYKLGNNFPASGLGKFSTQETINNHITSLLNTY